VPDKLLIIDWDDTVLPTSYLATEGVLRSADPIPKGIRLDLRKYAKRVKATLQLLAAHGRVVIVTNAEEGWVERSCGRFLPELEVVIRALPRISARPFGLEESDEVNPQEWKADAFVTLAQMHFATAPAGHTVFSLGDSIYEREAVHRTSERLGITAQSVKLLEHPSLEELEAEHASLQNGSLRALLGRVGSFDVCARAAQPVKVGGSACVEFSQIPARPQEVAPLDGFGSWNDLIEATTPKSELNKSFKSTGSMCSTTTGDTIGDTDSTDSSATSENAASMAEASEWMIVV
jgi:hypothetical protein